MRRVGPFQMSALMSVLSRTRMAVIILLGLTTFSPQLLAQTSLGTIRGSVKDQSDAPIPGVTVTATDAAGLKRTAVTDEWGNFEIAKIPAGRYQVEASLPGFKTFVDNQVDLRPVEVRRVDIVLEVGERTESVTVSGEAAAVVQAETPQVEGGWQRQTIEYTPRALRQVGIGGHSYLFETVGNADMGVYGQRSQASRLQVDGFTVGQQVHTAPPLDMWEEAKIVSLNSSAEYSSPSTYDIVMRRGTDLWTAKAAYVSANAALQASGWNPVRRRPVGAPNNWMTFSGRGPVYLPKIYDGRGRTHFFAAAEQQSTVETNVVTLTSAPNPFREGDFSQLLQPPAPLKPVQLKNPFTGAPIPRNDLRNIPGFSINPAAAGFMTFLPQAQRTPDLFVRDNWGPACNCRELAFTAFSVSVDHQQGDKDQFGYRLNWYNRPLKGDEGGRGLSHFGYSFNDSALSLNFQAVSWTRVLSPTFTSEFRVGMNRFFNFAKPVQDNRDVLGATGLKGVPLVAAAIGRPNLVFATSGLHGLNTVVFRDRLETSWTLGENLVRVAGKHTFKFGGEMRTWGVNQLVTDNSLYGRFTFTGRFTGFDFADFLLGLPDTVTLSSPRDKFYGRNQQVGLYFQDDFKAHPNLTFNLGLRWDLHGVAEDLNGLFFNYDPVTNALVVPDDRAIKAMSPLFPAKQNGGPIPVLTAAQAGFPKGLREPDRNDLYPRLGFAWRPWGNHKTVVRGGYGIYTTPVEQGAGFGSLPARSTGGLFGASFNFVNTITQGVPLIQLPNAVPAGFVLRGGTAPFVPYSLETLGIIRDYHNPYHQQWNLTIEREIPFRISVGLGYIGGKSTGLAFQRDLNRPRPSTVPFSNARRPLGPNFRNIRLVDNGGNQNTHGLELSFKRRFGQSFGFNTTYLWTRTITDAPDPGFFAVSDDLGFIIQDPLNRRAERGPASGPSSLPGQQFGTDLVWHVPIGRGRRWMNGLPTVADAILGGWVWSSYIIFQENPGFSTPVITGFDPSNTDWRFGTRPDRTCNGNISVPWRIGWGQVAFNTDCFPVPPANAGRFGNSGRGVLKAPQNPLSGLRQGFYKGIPIKEKLKLEISVQSINALNSGSVVTNWRRRDPNVDPTNINRGRIFPGGPRTLHLGVALIW